MIREPIVAGRFYPDSPSILKSQIKGYLDKEVKKRDVIGAVSPHAGYMYSGPVAGAVLSGIELKDTFIILGPNHSGKGQPFSIMTEGSWRTPLGEVEIDSHLGKEILETSRHLKEDAIAHLYEHSIEVQIPFLQYLKTDVKIVPIILSPAPAAVYKEIGQGIAAAIKKLKAKTVIIASSDMTHYETQESASIKDRAAIDTILALKEDELINRIKEMHITMCGYAPAVALIAAAKELGASKTELIRYQTSGDVSRDFSSVVGYAGILISK